MERPNRPADRPTDPDDDVPDDGELLDRYRGGDVRAFEELLTRHEPALSRFVKRQLPRGVRRRVDAADIVQETSIVAYRRRDAVDSAVPAAFRSWLFAIAANRVRGAVRHHLGVAKRSRRREAATGSHPTTSAAPATGRSPSEALVLAEEAAIVREALASLPDDDRVVLDLVTFQGMRLAEAAVAMGRSREATKKLYSRALARFGKEMRRRDGPAAKE